MSSTQTTDLSLYNVGAGVAKGVAYMVVAGGRKVSNVVGDGFMRPGEKVWIATQLPTDTGR